MFFSRCVLCSLTLWLLFLTDLLEDLLESRGEMKVQMWIRKIRS